jgi:hypothetical protein
LMVTLRGDRCGPVPIHNSHGTTRNKPAERASFQPVTWCAGKAGRRCEPVMFWSQHQIDDVLASGVFRVLSAGSNTAPRSRQASCRRAPGQFEQGVK